MAARSPRAKLVAAFSPWPHLVALVRPAPSRYAPVDGLRALAIVWVVAFHAAVYSVGVVPPSEWVRLLFSRSMLPSWRGAFGVDLFFVLSGFLIAGMLVREREDTGTVRLGVFYLRRFLRLFPALAVALALYVGVVGLNRDMAWAVLLYVGNFVPVDRACMPWTWSLSIEEQFYIVAPGLLAVTARVRPALRIPIVALVALALSGLAAYVAYRFDYYPFDTEIVPNRLPQRWSAAFDDLYDKTWMRAGPLLAGVAASFVHREERAMKRLAAARISGTIAFVAAIALAVASTHWPLVAELPRAVGLAYIGTFRLVFGIAVAYVLLFALSRHPVGAMLGKVLSHRALHPLAQLSYAAYLVNPIVAIVIRARLARRVFEGELGMPSLFAIDLVATFACALVIHVLVEKPFMVLRPPAPQKKAAPGGAARA